jgi:hypothetical protein
MLVWLHPLNSCMHMAFTSKLAFAWMPITYFSALISLYTFVKLHSPWIDIVDINNEDCCPFTRGGKTCFTWRWSIYNLLIEVAWPTQTTSRLLHSTEIPFTKANEITINSFGRWCIMGHKYSIRAFISKLEPCRYL